MSSKNSITYRQVGDYLIPNLTIPPEAKQHIGKWGQMHKDYLRNNRPVAFATLFAQGELWQYLADIDNQAREMFDTLVSQMKEKEGVTEQLKEENQMEWVEYMNYIRNIAMEIVNAELIFN